MFDLINGIPLHPLVVHAVVVLLPLTILGTLAIAAKPALAPSALPTAVSVLAVIAALAAGVQVYRVGDSGARAAWADKVSSSSSH